MTQYRSGSMKKKLIELKKWLLINSETKYERHWNFQNQASNRFNASVTFFKHRFTPGLLHFLAILTHFSYLRVGRGDRRFWPDTHNFWKDATHANVLRHNGLQWRYGQKKYRRIFKEKFDGTKISLSETSLKNPPSFFATWTNTDIYRRFG